MNKEETIRKFQEIGQKWFKGEYEIEKFGFEGGKEFVLNPKQKKFVNDLKSENCLFSGGVGCGKSAALYIKLLAFSLFFPKNRILLGRATISDIERTVLPDLFEMIPVKYYQHRVKEGIIRFFNGSQVILFGLEALQQGSEADIKKAQQKIKSLNLGAFFIEQLEEVEEDVFIMLGSRLRRTEVPVRQGDMTSNPALYWAYFYFKDDPKKENLLVEGATLDNKENLTEDFIQRQLRNSKRWIDRYFYGIWKPEILSDKIVFAEEYIERFESMKRRPIAVEEGCEIYQQPELLKYQMGVDPSEGVVDPSSISVISEEGEKVAKFNGKIPIFSLGGKVNFLYEKYHHPLIIPEANASGQALLLQVRDLNVYRRKVYEEKYDKETEKLGWKTSSETKQALISNFQELLRRNFPKIYDEKTIKEFRAFNWTDIARHKGAGAQKGFHDDDVMSTLLGFWGFSPKLIEKRKIRQEREKSRIRRKVFQYF